jgi:hypothetical protein
MKSLSEEDSHSRESRVPPPRPVSRRSKVLQRKIRARWKKRSQNCPPSFRVTSNFRPNLAGRASPGAPARLVGEHASLPGRRRADAPCHDKNMDVVIRGGTVVTPGHQEIADIRVRDGRIAQLGGSMTGGGTDINASGLLVIPGGIDAHVHLVSAEVRKAWAGPMWVDDFWSASLAASARAPRPRSPRWRRPGTPASRCSCPLRIMGRRHRSSPRPSRRPGGPAR